MHFKTYDTCHRFKKTHSLMYIQQYTHICTATLVIHFIFIISMRQQKGLSFYKFYRKEYIQFGRITVKDRKKLSEIQISLKLAYNSQKFNIKFIWMQINEKYFTIQNKLFTN